MPLDDQARSGTGHGGKFMIFDIDTIDIWITFLLSNMYVKFGDQVHRQIQGTPMGTNCASHLANLYLMMYELRFYVRLATLYVDPAFTFLRTVIYTIARAFLLTARYIDDLASINNPYLHSLLYVDQHFHHNRILGIYPRTLRVTTADSGISINYMDVTIQRQHSSSSRITTILYDKREHSPLADQFIIKFPHAMSNISAAAKYGVITSQYHRFRRIIMLRNDFTNRMAGLVHYMQSMGHDTSRMLKQIRGLCTRFIELYGADPWQLVRDIHHALTLLTTSHAT
ncbi:TPA: hypothetical protein ACH3X2_000518 [Trebouxia sp. C0005]|nr:MAG: hypothetical protein FRX49_11881 [Trebouxia sp. A1-2]